MNDKQPKLELYYWPTPNGWKITILLEELNVPYDLHLVDIVMGEQFEEDFLRIAPNNRMPAIVDPDGPDDAPISIFESGAIMVYLTRKFARFGGSDERMQIDVMQWLMWQMGGLGPMAGQAHHFRKYAPESLPYAIDRYSNECNRLYAVMNTRLKDRDFLAGEYSIADMACIGWIILHKHQGQTLDDFPNLKNWYQRIRERPAVERGLAVARDIREQAKEKIDDQARALLFNQRARKD